MGDFAHSSYFSHTLAFSIYFLLASVSNGNSRASLTIICKNLVSSHVHFGYRPLPFTDVSHRSLKSSSVNHYIQGPLAEEWPSYTTRG